MFRLRSAAILRRSALAAATGAGVALVGVSFANIASLDGDLQAAVQQPPPAVQERAVSYVPDSPRPCERDAPRRSDRRPQSQAESSLRY